MPVVLLTTLLPPNTYYGEEDKRWTYVQVYQAVDLVWAVWIFNSVFGKLMQHWIQSGLNRRNFSDFVLTLLTIASVVHMAARIVMAIIVVPWLVPLQLFLDRFFVLMVITAYAAISRSLILASNTDAAASTSKVDVFKVLSVVTTGPILLAMIAQVVVAARAPHRNWELEVLVCAAIAMAFVIEAFILNLARSRVQSRLNKVKAFLSPMQARREKRMLRKLNYLTMFTIFGVFLMGGYAVHLWVLHKVNLDDPASGNVEVRDSAIVMAMGFLELLFAGVSAATAADLFDVTELKPSSPFYKLVTATASRAGVLVSHQGTIKGSQEQKESRPSSSVRGAQLEAAPASQASQLSQVSAANEQRELDLEREWRTGLLQTAEDQALWWKKLNTLTWKEFTTFPNPISEAEIRIWIFIMAFICALSPVLDIFAGSPVFYWFILYELIVRTLFGIRLDPIAYLAMFVIKPYVVDRWELIEDLMVAGPPRRQAMINPIPPTLMATIAWHCGWPYGARWIGGLLAATCFAQAFYDVCLGCAVFWIMIKLKIAPREQCEVCTVTLGASGEQYCLSRPKKTNMTESVIAQKSVVSHRPTELVD
ncbi:uncharacterized protein SPPG_07546 [Spizellomyces punctatus DAOM BR117]|uniref:DUF4395 domain-containing protein n=1 Tax=Spizellomyces punctatus (strain DAOM BR117) TaxID=645134 RepID=A0A0L0H885_SPIPD|nr:uncharacterized protein SPPG_07546 [Spizellomyces punctatus DAOM BR117]KNC97156.1 hypothetical protein SPPG_07546 [Spizellomyces punctatus DAOM BR117]|eukprot:XP_016605196.1 hypothetical protein SPPG_07546 [Spizellomyces punctatus DAOM BR117]